MRRRIDWASLALGLAVLGLVFWLFYLRPPQAVAVEEAVFDQFQRWQPRAYLLTDPATGERFAPPVRVIDIDERSLREIGQWPWPRTYLAEMVRRLSDAGAAVIAFDMTFAEPDRTSPALLAQSLGRFGAEYAGKMAALAGGGAELPDHDRLFAGTIAQTPVVLGAIATDDDTAGRLPPRPGGIAISGGGDIRRAIEWFRNAIPNLEVLDADAIGVGTTVLAKTEGTVVRRVPLIVAIGDEPNPFPALSVEALRVALGASSFIVKTSLGSGETDFSGAPSVVSMKVGPFVVPLEPDGTLRVRYSDARDERVIPAWRLLDPAGLPPEIAGDVAGSILFVGASAASLFDVKATPVADRIAGVHVHAEVAEQILQEAYLTRPDWATGIERLVTLLGGLAVIGLLAANRPLTGFAVMGLGVAGVAAGSWWAFSQEALLLSPVAPVLGLALPHFAVSGYKYFTAEASRREVTRQFEHFVSPEVIQDIIDDPERYLTPGGAQRVLTIMFLDVRRFSTITEKMAPQEVIAFINKLLTPLTDAIIAEQGTIDKYMGDAVMAFWNAPRDTEGHEAHAVRAMLAFGPIMQRLNGEFTAQGLPEIGIGVGINTGECSVGNMGSLKRLAYSCVGDSVNLASRLEGQTKAYGVGNLLGARTAAGLPGFAAIEIDSLAVKGRTQPETVFTVAGDETVAKTPEYAAVAGAIAGARFAYLAQDWDTAEAAFAEIAAMPPVGTFDPRPFAEVFLARVAQYRVDPPPPDWDGVYVATSK